MINIDSIKKNINFTGFNYEDRAILIANQNLLETFLQVTMTLTIAERAETRDEITACRKMKDRGIELLETFLKENERKNK